MQYPHYTTGYSLVEVLVAITILLLAVAGPMTIASKGLQSSFFARDQLTAYMLAQEGVESMIALRNESILQAAGTSYADMWTWANPNGALDVCFTDDGDAGCNLDVSDSALTDGTLLDDIIECSPVSDCLMDYDPNTTDRAHYYLNTAGTNNDSPFTRVIKLTELQADKETEVEVTVSWNPVIFGGATKTVVVRTVLFNTYGN